MGAAPVLSIGLPTLPAGLPATGVADAVALTVRGRRFPTVPVPAGGPYSLMSQAATGFEGVDVLPTDELCVDTARFGVHPVAAASTCAEAFEPLRATLAQWPSIVAEVAPEAVRVDVVGPVTLATALCVAGIPRSQALEAATTASVYRAESIVATVRAVERTATVAVVMVEPALVGAMHPTYPFTSRQVRSMLDPVVDTLDLAAGDSDIVIGIHVPGRSDWRTIISSGVSLLSTPPDAALVGSAQWVQALLDNGGHIVWGAVPVDRPVGSGEELLWRRLSATWGDLASAGVDGAMLSERSLVGPSDELSRFGIEQIPGIVELVDRLAARVGDHAPARLAPALS